MPISAQKPYTIPENTSFDKFIIKHFRVDGNIVNNNVIGSMIIVLHRYAELNDGKKIFDPSGPQQLTIKDVFDDVTNGSDFATFRDQFLSLVVGYNNLKQVV